MKNGFFFSSGFAAAARDYEYLLNRSYPQKPVIKVIGDRYGLSRIERHLLFRGICPGALAEHRKIRLTADLQDRHLAVDGYNVIFTVMNYLLGRPIFLATDGLLRDVGESFKKIRQPEIFRRACVMIMDQLKIESPRKTVIFLDSPVSHSGLHREFIQNLMKNNEVAGETRVTPSADYELKQYHGDILATSDSVIIDHTDMLVTDLPRICLEKKVQAIFFDLKNLISSG